MQINVSVSKPAPPKLYTLDEVRGMSDGAYQIWFANGEPYPHGLLVRDCGKITIFGCSHVYTNDTPPAVHPIGASTLSWRSYRFTPAPAGTSITLEF